MKKLISIILSAVMIAGVFTSLPAVAAEKKKTVRVSLKKVSVTLKISSKNSKTIYGTTAVKLSKVKGVTLKKVTYKTSNRKVATVTKGGTVKAVKKGSAAISVSVRFQYKKKSFSKVLKFKVTVKDTRKTAPVTEPTTVPVPTHSTTIPAPIPTAVPTEATEPPTETATDAPVVPSTEPPTATQPVTGTDVAAEKIPLNTVPELKSNSSEVNGKAFRDKLSAFSNKLYEMTSESEQGNYTMSPISIYMALSMLHAIGDDNVKSDIESFIGMNSDNLAETGKLFRSLTKNYKSYGFYAPEDNQEANECSVSLSNSVWVDSNEKANEDTLKKLADELYCGAFSTPFADNNAGANKSIREYIKEQTNGLIDKDFGLEPGTLFALINTLYFKDFWSFDYNELGTEKRAFTLPEKKYDTEFLIGAYLPGKIQETDTSRYFYTTTAHGYKLKLILPKDGCTLKDAMKKENLNAVNTDAEFGDTDADGTEHFTRCIFPSFKVNSDTPLLDIIEKSNALPSIFTPHTSTLLDKLLVVSDIKHSAVIDVTKKGIEGAAVTIISEKAGAAPVEKPPVYHNFILDKSFGFIITDKNDVVLFEGQVTNP